MLLGNYSVLNKSPLRFFAGSTTSPETQVPSMFMKSGTRRNRLYKDQDTTALKSYGLPEGAYPSVSFFLPQVSGNLSAHYTADVSTTASGYGAMGVAAVGSVSVVVTVADADGQLISSGTGSVNIVVTVGNALLTASLNGTGSANATVTTNNPLLGALASIIASSLSSVSGSLTPYAIGQMIGSNLTGGALTETSIASAVWSSTASSYNSAGTMGEKLNGAGSAGNPWTQVIDSGLTAAQVMKIILAVQTGKSTIVDHGGGTATIVFKDKAGTADVVTADMTGSARTTVTLSP